MSTTTNLLTVAVASEPTLRQTVIDATLCAEDAVKGLGQLGSTRRRCGRAVDGPVSRRPARPPGPPMPRGSPSWVPEDRGRLAEWRRWSDQSVPIGNDLVTGLAAAICRNVDGRHIDAGLAFYSTQPATLLRIRRQLATREHRC